MINTLVVKSDPVLNEKVVFGLIEPSCVMSSDILKDNRRKEKVFTRGCMFLCGSYLPNKQRWKVEGAKR